MRRGPKPVDVQTLFWRHVTRGPIDACWLFRGTTTAFGYGQLKSHQKKYLAHRISYQIHKGEPPADRQVCHSCDVPACCNAHHLWLGTHKDNSDDKHVKKRANTARGEAKPTSKLCARDIPAIRSDPRSNHTLARAYGVSHATIGEIKRGKAWRHVQ